MFRITGNTNTTKMIMNLRVRDITRRNININNAQDPVLSHMMTIGITEAAADSEKRPKKENMDVQGRPVFRLRRNENITISK